MDPDTQPRAIAPSLFLTALVYGGMVVLAGVLGFKQVALGPLAVESGIFAFLLLVVMSSATAELHGRAVANRLVLWGFVPLGVAFALTQLVLWLPVDENSYAPEAFETVLSGTLRIWIAGPIAYGVSMFLNVYLFNRLRGNQEGESKGGALMVRAAIASALSQAIDTVIFITIAFAGTRPIMDLMIGQASAKVALSLVVVPFLIQGAVMLGRKLDRKGA
ncbi:queuosine precursor transporter [Alteriqipengyuania flavescens]|uniref:queuosine precursor transporter n=1 Tax=Alteriqipengyuania flavescens TaxID=3053610 RepID=UPI0025B2DAD8|nr:queuosine precursor transporter [Alteriqipengyuania flavescens]WJY19314.1 queuosine precursor transporter [Alteriqipengyuania flavescens]WJY25255.1 queuosine precursor transporter [Alteriqipengyuania flavescens]